MASDFHWDMDRYLTNRRRKKVFSGLKTKVMNKKAVFSYKASNKFGDLKSKISSKIGGIRSRKEPEKEISQEDITSLMEKKGIGVEAREKKEEVPVLINPDVTKSQKLKISEGLETKSQSAEEKKAEAVEEAPKAENIGEAPKAEAKPKESEKIGEGEGWKEVKLPSVEKEEQKLTNLEGEKKRLQDNLVKIQEKGKTEKEKIVKLGDDNQQRAKVESEEDKRKRLELMEEIKVLKEKERIEEDRLGELKKARRREQMESLRGKVTDILFKKRTKQSKDMVEEVRKEIRMEAKVGEAERQRAEIEQSSNSKEDVVKAEDKKIGEVTKKEEALREEKKVEAPKVEGKPEEKKEEKPKEEPKVEKKLEEKKPKKSFLSRFIQIKTASQLAKEEEERLKREEEEALKDKSEIDNMLEGEEKATTPAEEQDVNLSTLFSKGEVEQKEDIADLRKKEDTIDLGKDYKIKVVKN